MNISSLSQHIKPYMSKPDSSSASNWLFPWGFFLPSGADTTVYPINETRRWGIILIYILSSLFTSTYDQMWLLFLLKIFQSVPFVLPLLPYPEPSLGLAGTTPSNLLSLPHSCSPPPILHTAVADLLWRYSYIPVLLTNESCPLNSRRISQQYFLLYTLRFVSLPSEQWLTTAWFSLRKGLS